MKEHNRVGGARGAARGAGSAAGGHSARMRFSPQSQTQSFAALDFDTTVDAW